ncbi:MAG TPA: hypothetical protein P5323_00210 [Candidatus Moranbacteria bacterium]|nr:hypothetical protein [Candidatus Moranbacteria bacterium]HSA07776.1 hypothetical protein [Candidatus Moranbacteria bacterium]
MKKLFLGFWFWQKIALRHSWLGKIKRLIWNRSIKLQWNRLWIRKDEFHKSLNWDSEAVLGISQEQRKIYVDDLVKRRHIAHERDLMKKSPAFRVMVNNR